jgi:hypothetical protein
MALNPKYFIDLEFARIDLFDNFLMVTVNEGMVFDSPEVEKIVEIANAHFFERPFGYISNRKNDYTVNPTCYKGAEENLPNMVGIATLCYSEFSYKTAVFAEQFFNWPHKAFYTVEECVGWISGLIEQKKAGR